jgi:peptide/nickel transport system ATP-binding protein
MDMQENKVPSKETEGTFAGFDDEAERAKEQNEREEKAKADKLLPPDPDALLEVRHLKKYFVLKKSVTGKPLSTLKAVDDISFKIKEGETLGIVGESGCGKTTMGRTVLKLHQPTAGQVFFEGKDIAEYKPAQMRALRTKMQIVFQDPYSSLPPRSTVGGILAEAVKVHKIVPQDQIKDYVLEVMDRCGLRDYYYERYPHEFSGGQRQRICIARALVVNPKLVVCDEPVSALDVSIQAQIINLLKELQIERKLTYLFISHDLSVVKYISDKIGVMYLGSMMEYGDKDKIFNNPLHPYSVALFSAVPNPNPDEKGNRIILKGDIPSPANPPMGCKFHTRCPRAMEICKHIAPAYREMEEGHFVACHCYDDKEN